MEVVKMFYQNRPKPVKLGTLREGDSFFLEATGNGHRKGYRVLRIPQFGIKYTVGWEEYGMPKVRELNKDTTLVYPKERNPNVS